MPQNTRGGVPPKFIATLKGTIVKAGQMARFDAKLNNDATKPIEVHWMKVNIVYAKFRTYITLNLSMKTFQRLNDRTDKESYQIYAANLSKKILCTPY